MQLASTVAAAQHAGQERLAPTHRTAYHETLAVGVVGDQALVPLVFGPGQVTLMVVEEQDLPFGAPLADAADDPLAPRL